ncbi:MAG: hypothetical protein V1707_02385 [bacterium]
MLWTYFILFLLTISLVELTKGWLKGYNAKAVYAVVISIVLAWLYGWYSDWLAGELGETTLYALVTGVIATGLYRTIWMFCRRQA